MYQTKSSKFCSVSRSSAINTAKFRANTDFEIFQDTAERRSDGLLEGSERGAYTTTHRDTELFHWHLS